VASCCSTFTDPTFAFRVERVVNDELALENFVITQSQPTEAGSNPAQTFASWMGIARMRVCRAHNLTEQTECWVSEFCIFSGSN
jgi:hypothetical protein